jgi:25S rRNA (cytosine2278-C5)-methyltransferase
MTYDDVDAPPRVREKKINVPMQYRNGAKFLKAYLEDGKSLSNAIDNNHCKVSSMYSLLSKIRANKHILDQVIEKTGIFEKEPRLNPWMGKFLIGELLFGRGQLTGNSKPVTCVLSYEDQFREALTTVDGEISTEKFEYKSKF